jgi:hypothetical protein
VAAFAVAIGVDGAQLLLGPLGWWLADEGLDLVAMVLMIWLLGFHPLLLPTFVIEFLPVADVLPTWTGCVGLVVALRRRRARTGDGHRVNSRASANTVLSRVRRSQAMEDDSRGITAVGFAPTIPRRLRERLMRCKLHKGQALLG